MTGRAAYREILRGMLVLAAILAVARQAAAQPSSAAACSGCHAPVTDGPVPSLIGRPATDIVAAMAAFRSGTREATVMDRIAKGFTDEEISAIAQWYEAQPQPANNP
jgi:sulfide dehydrogenase cytochrome subunit